MNVKHRYIVKPMLRGDIGVYDTERASFPVNTPELRKIGVSNLGWLRGKDGMAEAERIVALLNGYKSADEAKIDGPLSENDDLAALAQSLIEDQAGANA